jgi:hypothetical protein
MQLPASVPGDGVGAPPPPAEGGRRSAGSPPAAPPRAAPRRPARKERAVNAPVRLHDQETIAAELDALATAASLSAGFRAGAAAGLRWVTGGGPGPLTRVMATSPPAWRAVVAELSAAEAVIYGRPSARHDFALGVEHALLWAEFATPTPPSVRSAPAPGTCEVPPDVSGPGEERLADTTSSAPPSWPRAGVTGRARRSRPTAAGSPGPGDPADRL